MKKYIQPTTELIFITPTLLDGTSVPQGGGEVGSDDVLAPKWSLFDDEDDEEENVY